MPFDDEEARAYDRHVDQVRGANGHEPGSEAGILAHVGQKREGPSNVGLEVSK